MARFDFKPGDIIENLHASTKNPLRISVVIEATASTIVCSTFKGHRANYENKRGTDGLSDWLIKRGEITIPAIEPSPAGCP